MPLGWGMLIMGDTDTCMWVGDIAEISGPSVQLCCELKTGQKIKPINLNNANKVLY